MSVPITVSRPVPCPLRLLPVRRSGADRHLEVERVFDHTVADARLWRALPPGQRYLARIYAVARERPDAVFCLESAAALLGMPTPPLTHEVHVLGEGRRLTRRAGPLHFYADGEERQVLDLDGIRAVAPADTAVDFARLRHQATALAVADATLRLDPSLRSADLLARNDCRRRPVSHKAAQWSLARADPRARCAIESVSRAVITWCGFAEPVVRRRVLRSGRAHRTALWWPTTQVAGVIDSASAPTCAEALPPGFVRWGAPELHDPARLIDLLNRAGVPRIRAIAQGPLGTLNRTVLPF